MGMPARDWKNVLAVACLAVMASYAQAAEEKPLWEIGLGVGAFSFPSYRGSDQINNFLIPVPLFTYHGDFFKADRHGIRGSFLDTDRIDLTVSFALSPPAPSRNIDARQDMPDLKASFEIGPEVDFTFWRSENRARFVKLLVPLRAALTGRATSPGIFDVLETLGKAESLGRIGDASK